MRILITNDDGIDAPGIAALESFAREFGECITVAPGSPQSGCGHQLTFGRTMKLVERAPERFSLDAMPADCVRVAIARFGTFDWVLSGINLGANLGADVYVSGTVAATREAALAGIPAIAISQYRNNMSHSVNWDKSSRMAHVILSTLLKEPMDPIEFCNINLPDVSIETPEVVWCDVDSNTLPIHYEFEGEDVIYNGDYHKRTRTPGLDVDVCFGGKISISKVSV